jgi:HEAT repeat protein
VAARDFHGEDPGISRAAELSALGHRRRLPAGAAARIEKAAQDDPDGRARAAAVGALVRIGGIRQAERAWRRALTDDDPLVRRRVADLGPLLARRRGHEFVSELIALLADDDTTVVVAAAWALGEFASQEPRADEGRRKEAVAALAKVTTDHKDAIAREAAVAALGALGHPDGLEAILAACRDKPTVRRRAVLALAPFEGAAVDAALATASEDKDWQVRQAAEDLVAEPKAGNGFEEDPG